MNTNKVKTAYVSILAGIVITLFSLMAVSHSAKFGCIPQSNHGTINTDNTAVVQQQIKGWPIHYSYAKGCNFPLALGGTEFSSVPHPQGFQPAAFVADVVIWSAVSYLVITGTQITTKRKLPL